MELIRTLRHTLLTTGLPGRDAQFRMAHLARVQPQEAPPEAQKAAVLVILFPADNNWQLIFIKRKDVPGDHHRAQISFPGGKYEPADATLIQTALRETEEEIGVLRNQFQVIGPLTELYIPVSNFEVHPYLACLGAAPSYTMQESEVSAVLEVPLSNFLQPDARQERDIRVREDLLLKSVPCFDVHGETLWGATAMMLNELLELIHPWGTRG